MDEPDTRTTPPEDPEGDDAARDGSESASTPPPPEPESESSSGIASGATASAGGRASTARRGGRVPRRGARITARSLLALLSVAVLALTGLGWGALGVLENQLNRIDLREGDSARQVPRDTATDILLVGNDSRTDAQGDPLPEEVLDMLRTESASGLNTDTLILLRVPDDGTSPTAVSIPRDTAVRRSGRSQKINGVYGLTKRDRARELRAEGGHTAEEVERLSKRAGVHALINVVESLTGVGVDHYAEVNLLGFYEVTRALGGVRVCLKRPTSDKNSGADFPAGEQTISGGDALSFVRQRHGLPDGDLDRIVRQQVFMAAVADKVLSSGTLTDTERINDLVAAARKSVVLDSSWGMMDFVRRMQSLASGNIGFVTIPVSDTTVRNSAGRSVVTVDDERVKEFVAGFGHDVGPSAPASETGSPGESPGGSTEPTHRVAGRRLVRLDGARAAPSAKPRSEGSDGRDITPEGIPCVY
ncbi:LCP family protein [Actinopolyspora erythraea]|uniref:LCP family protein n=1 Tax=Actinopolyspora erythraea TaxID=414996 RepID=UPI0009FF3C68|nr:LCP family protein [Actinopolyspora erythraea]